MKKYLWLLMFVSTTSFGYISEGTKDIPTFYTNIVYGLSNIHQSKLVNSNSPSTLTGYTLGAFAGVNKSLGLSVSRESVATTFELNSSSFKLDWQDVILRYRFAYFYLGLNLSQVELKVNKEQTDILDAGGNGLGYTGGMLIPFKGSGSFVLDYTAALITKVRNSLDQEVTSVAKSDLDLHLDVAITSHSFGFISGYKQRTLSIKTDASYNDLIKSTYLGFRASLDF